MITLECLRELNNVPMLSDPCRAFNTPPHAEMEAWRFMVYADGPWRHFESVFSMCLKYFDVRTQANAMVFVFDKTEARVIQRASRLSRRIVAQMSLAPRPAMSDSATTRAESTACHDDP